MIKTLIFDFGDVFINLNKEATYTELNKLGIHSFSEEMLQIIKQYEIGVITSHEFCDFYKNIFPNISVDQIVKSWNAIILDFPEYRLNFIEELSKSKKYKLILLSNTNELHIEKVIENMSIERYKRFKNCFDSFYLSHEINLRKPNAEIFEYVLKTHDLIADECFFVDDTNEHTDIAKSLGIHIWNLNPETEDIINIFSLNKELF